MTYAYFTSLGLPQIQSSGARLGGGGSAQIATLRGGGKQAGAVAAWRLSMATDLEALASTIERSMQSAGVPRRRLQAVAELAIRLRLLSINARRQAISDEAFKKAATLVFHDKGWFGPTKQVLGEPKAALIAGKLKRLSDRLPFLAPSALFTLRNVLPKPNRPLSTRQLRGGSSRLERIGVTVTTVGGSGSPDLDAASSGASTETNVTDSGGASTTADGQVVISEARSEDELIAEILGAHSNSADQIERSEPEHGVTTELAPASTQPSPLDSQILAVSPSLPPRAAATADPKVPWLWIAAGAAGLLWWMQTQKNS